MAIKNIIAQGIGFTPSTIKWIVTHGFGSSADVIVAGPFATPGLQIHQPGQVAAEVYSSRAAASQVHVSAAAAGEVSGT